MEQVFTTADKLSEVIRNMQKCLQCIICLHTITNPIKTTCGHRFCRTCIQKVLKTENALCPLCNNILQRRSIFTDEQMVVYIDRFQKLINGIQFDSGIDILSTLTKPCNVRDSCSSDDSECHKLDDEDVIKPSCSYAKSNAQWKRLNPRSNLNQRSQRKPRGRRGRRKAEPQVTNTVMRYISTCGLSGIEPLGPDELKENSSDKSVNKVHGWLDALPDNEMLDDPVNMPNVESTEANLDDTLPISVSQNVANMEIESVDKMNEIVVESVVLNNIPQSMAKQLPKSSSRKGNNSIGKKDRRDSCDTKIVQNYSSRMDCETENAKPGPSAGTKSNDDGKEKSEDKFNDVHRTSPCDMLSTMQQNWSVVAKFGKEMRTKRKKLKTLNVSIENKGKPRPLDEPGAKLDEGEVRSIVMDDTRKKRRKGSSKSKMAEYITKTVAQEGFVEARKRKGKMEVRERKASLNKERDKSVSGKDQQNDEPFIMLSDDEPENVPYLKDQINDIIGVTSSGRGAGTKKDVANNREEMTIGKKRHVDSSDTNLRDRLKMPLQMTPAKLTRCADWESPTEESRNRKDDGPTTPKSGIDESHSPLKTSSAIRGRLSLKRPTTDVKSNDAVDSNIVSRQQVRRDLSRQIDQDEGNDEVSKKNVKRVSKTEKRKSFARDKQDSRRASNSTIASEFASSRIEKKMHNMSLVSFKKLGKTYKRRKKHVSFLYLGTTRRNAMLDSSCAELTHKLQKPCNLVDIFDSQTLENDCTSENGFGNRARITVNSSPSTYYQEIESVPKEIEFITEVNDVSGAKGPMTEDTALEDRFGEQIRENPAKEKVSVKETIRVANNPQDPYTLLVSVNEESIPPGVRRPNTSNNACKDDVKMLSPTKDSQLQFLSLESPPMDTLPTQKLFEEPGLATEGPFKRKSFVQPDSEVLQEFSDCTSKKRRRSNTQKTFSRKISTDKNEDDRASNHSFSSQVTCISKDAVAKKSNFMETCQSSSPSTKDIDAISLSSDAGIMDNAARDKRKAYKRIMPLVASDTDSNDVVCVNNLPNDHPAVSSTTKRKRYMSFDSESESGLEEILSNWYAEAKLGDQCKKKGKLEQACDSSNSMNASRAARDDALSKACSSGRGESTNKLSTQQRRNPLELAGKSGIEESSFTRARLRKNIDSTGGQVVDEDSPDFGATIDKMKDIRNKMTVSVGEQGITKEESLMQDNMDDIFANVNTDVLADEYAAGKGEKCKGKSVECQKLTDYDRNIKQKRSNVENVYSSSEGLSRVRSNSSNKENKNSGADVLCVSDEADNTLVPTTVNMSSKSAKSNKFQDKIKPVRASRESSRIQMNRSSHNPIISSDYNKFSTNDSYVKDTYDMDSLMNITQRDMLLKQFEQDLFGKPKSNSPPGKHQKTPQKSRRSKECSKENKKDVEHSGEEDDIVENTPDTKTKNMQAITSPPGSSIASSISKITVRPFLAKSTPSTIGKSSVSVSMPGCKRNMQPLYQSTPKSQKFATSSNNFVNRKFLPVANESSSKQTRRNVVRETIDQSVQNVQNVGRQRLCFVCSGLLQSEITEVKRLAEMFNARYVMQFDRDVSHVIVKADKENNGANKTLKYLQGIAHRKWIVTHDWVLNSLKQCRLVNEEPYEAVDSRTLEAGPRKSRLSERRLFEGFMFLCIGPYSDVSVDQYRELISAAGATVVDSLDALAAEKNMLKIIVIQTDIYEYEIIEWFKKAQAVAIVHDWVVECISQFQLISFFPYMQELTRHDVLSLGYPEYLVEEDNDVESESTCDFTT